MNDGIYHLKYWKCVICTAYCIYLNTFLSRSMYVCLYLLHFLKSLCLDCFAIVLFHFKVYLFLVVWFVADIAWACVFIPLSIHRCEHTQISNCTHFIQMNFCMWVQSGENLMCKCIHTYTYINIDMQIIRLMFTVHFARSYGRIWKRSTKKRPTDHQRK